MEHRSKPLNGAHAEKGGDECDLESLLHPAKAFTRPMDVVWDADLTLNEKRAILASWASDVCATEAAAELRIAGSVNLVSWDDIMDAMFALSQELDGGRPLPHYKKVAAKQDDRPLQIRSDANAHKRSRRTLN